MGLFDLFREVNNKEVIIRNEFEKELYHGEFNNLSMKYAYFKVCKVIEEDDIIIVYI